VEGSPLKQALTGYFGINDSDVIFAQMSFLRC
jgi:hypothetical protein